jgi:hypothetical protein
VAQGEAEGYSRDASDDGDAETLSEETCNDLAAQCAESEAHAYFALAQTT